MKRIGQLFNKLCTLQNIDVADANARKHKVHRYNIKRHDKRRDEDNKNLLNKLLSGTYKTSNYQLGEVREPKRRIIYKLPYYPDRITHHAIMNVIKDTWVNNFIKETYSCIEGRGIHACAKAVKKALREHKEDTTYCLKLDVTKFYPSIPHNELKKTIRKKIKDKRFLLVLDEVIESTNTIDEDNEFIKDINYIKKDKGVPIGNYLSQFLANLYLSELDHLCKEELKLKYYFRYADDIVILSNDKEFLHKVLIFIKLYLSTIGLKVKPNYQVFPVAARGIDFVGYKFYHTHTLIRKSIKNRIRHLINRYTSGKITRDEFKCRMSAYFGWLKYADTKHFLFRLQVRTGIRYSNWCSKTIKISRLYNKYVRIVDIMFYPKYYKIFCVRNHRPYIVKTKDRQLLHVILSNKKRPLTFKIIKYNTRLYFHNKRSEHKPSKSNINSKNCVQIE